MLRRVTLVRKAVSKECNTSIIRMTIIFHSVLRLLVTAIVDSSSATRVTLMMDEIRDSETSVSTRATQRSILEDDIFCSHSRETLKFSFNGTEEI
jgi:hypothetical protein